MAIVQGMPSKASDSIHATRELDSNEIDRSK
jgi:hypothetical protein